MSKKILVVVGIIWGLVVVTGITYFQMKKSSEQINVVELDKKENMVVEEGKVEKATLYILSDKGDKLTKKEEEIPHYIKSKDKIRKIVQLSIENLYKNKMIKTSQIEIGNIFITEDITYIDLEADMLELKAENRKNLLAIYSIVNSVTEIGNIQKIKFLIDGREEEEGSFSKVYTRNTNI